MKKTVKNVLLAVIVLLLVCGGVFVGMNWNNWFGEKDTPATGQVDKKAEDWTGEQEVYTGEKNTDTIDIPGFDSMTFKADAAEQAVNLYNPKQNTCYFKMSLYLKDDTKLWESNLVEPGKGIYEMELLQSLPAGSYEDAILKYECFAMDEKQTPLNGSEIKLTLKVME
ncbi:tRNA (uracil-5-)-methyltransferase [Faecalicatena sp. AGMB00832]|uniref:tRNA (Uracil-5-)-methyltransferase n=1 Tax=Faecalicatena faecalis TaxID=2726362 RepID=A0ABS6D4G8_9FIRM|nr:tRNA (uracil-5-)-methyltransferase [Faecalicatena faecalis]MBU3876376.1 tRNA (uracil-5-)-methyltransferase [Faecalicatena faecalis]